MPTLRALVRRPQRQLLRLAALGAIAALVVPGGACTDRPAEGAAASDVTAEAGVFEELDLPEPSFHHDNGMIGERWFFEVVGSGAGLLDHDGDGDLDLYLVQGGPIGPPEPDGRRTIGARDSLWRNDSEPGRVRFVDVGASAGDLGDGYGMGVAAGDFDGDGRVDLYVTNFGPNQLLRNRGDGSFEDVTASAGPAVADPRWSTAAAFLDFDADGDLDLFVANYVDGALANHKTCRTRSGKPDYCGPDSFPEADDRLLRNRGDGTFEDATALLVAPRFGEALGAVVGDWNDDGRLDLYVANDGSANNLWVQQPDGRFRDEASLRGVALSGTGATEAGMGVLAHDLDGDGAEELLLAHLHGETNTLYRNLGDGLFVDATDAVGFGAPSRGRTGFGLVAADFDGDGHSDVLVANGRVRTDEEQLAAGVEPPLLEPNLGLWGGLGDDGRLRFRPMTTDEPFLTRREVSRGLAVGDLDGDGAPDVVLTNNNGPARVYRNRLGPPAHWLGLRVVEGAAGRERDALGARVEIAPANGPPIARRVRTEGSYLSAHDPRILLALPAPPSEDSPVMVTARFVDGGEREWRIGEANRYVTLSRASREESR